MTAPEVIRLEGPYFDDLPVGQQLLDIPSVTLTETMAASRHAVVGGRHRLTLDRHLCHIVARGPLADPALVWDMAIGQSTVATEQVTANLFYRGLAFHRFPMFGDTLSTTVLIDAARRNRAREGRSPTGALVLRIQTRDQDGRIVLDFRRCAMLSAREPDTGYAPVDDFDALPELTPAPSPGDLIAGWRLEALTDRLGKTQELTVGAIYEVVAPELVSAAPELVRLTLNLARVHRDASFGGGHRLVYGGHAIGIAFAQLTRIFPGLIAASRWHSCDHLSPVHEGDLLRTTAEILGVEEVAGRDGVRLVRLAVGQWVVEPDAEDRQVLAWDLETLIA